MGFTKLDSCILDSSVWFESVYTRVVWVAFLAKADANGFVAASYQGMQHASNVPADEFGKAVKVLESPDPDSRSPEHDGRRIEKVEGGWVVLNYRKYRQYSYSNSPDAVRQRKHREKANNIVTSCDMSRSARDISASASASASDLKHKYGEYKHVLLTDTERDRFMEKHGKVLFGAAVKILDEGIEMKGYKYKNHNLVLYKWPLERAKEQCTNRVLGGVLIPEGLRK